MTDEQGGYGQQDPYSASSEFNAQVFLINQILGNVRTTVMVEIMGVTNSGGVEPVGFVDAKPLVNQLDGAGNSVPHETIYNLCYFRLQGGANAIILDPQIGDIGFTVIADRDSSAVKASKAQANPGSFRRFDLADGIYLGGILNGTPAQYVQFSSAGIKIHSPVLVNLDAPDVQINCQTLEIDASTSVTITTPNFNVVGDTAFTGEVEANGKDIGSTHLHSGVTAGGSNTGAPV